VERHGLSQNGRGMAKQPPKLVRFSKLRRVVQILVFALFIVILIRTVSPLKTWLPADFILRVDPLAAASTAMAARDAGRLLNTFLPALILLASTALLGRFFCNWVCPLGTTLDIWERLIGGRGGARRAGRIRNPGRLRNLKYYVLVFFLVAAVFSTQAVWLMDPLPIATRSYGLAVYPYGTYLAKSVLGPLWKVPVVNRISEPIYGFLKDHVFFPNPDLGYQPIGVLQHVTFLVFAGILTLSLLTPRFWCRYLCPLGAMLGLTSRMSLLRWRVDKERCTECNRCVRECKTAAIQPKAEAYLMEECVECMDCIDVCPEKALAFGFISPGRALEDRRRAARQGASLSRRHILQATALAAVAAPFVNLNVVDRDPSPWLIRPPGSLPEREFLDRCIRCGECMKVCPTNALHPALFQGGLEGVGTPMLVPALGYCDYECNACSQVCPTGAIRPVALAEKKQLKIGTAYFNKNKCYPWNENLDCLVCEEHCPTPEKAIKFWDVEVLEPESNRLITVKRPYVVTEACIGCGICETKCPLKDEPGIRVTARGETRNPERYSEARGL
jgi:MauM/NapG family ferredoxin protein